MDARREVVSGDSRSITRTSAHLVKTPQTYETGLIAVNSIFGFLIYIIIMCEWLACEEWCDVFLLCGGRVFSAHRAVLASVSKFLRKLLLSSAIDETPTFIVMPDFDLETMSSALHYIYNGEVIIEKHQLDTFLDIMNALQVFVDTRHLIDDKDTQTKKYLSIDQENIMIEQNTPAPAGADIVTIKKEINVKSNARYLSDRVKFTKQDSDNYKFTNIWTGYLKSLEDRQRQQLSSDLFIETYSLNRSNGVTEGVLAMSNELYHETTSVLLENANVDHLRNDLLSNTYKMDSENALRTLYNGSQAFKSCKVSDNMCDKSELKKNNTHNRINNICEDNPLELQQKLKSHSINDRLLSRHANHFNFNSNKSDKSNQEEQCRNASENENDLNKSKQSITRVILNEVLQSPWRPQLPNNYTPFKKKSIKLSGPQKSETLQPKKKDSTNDKNNNNNKSTKFESHQNNPMSNEMELKKIKRNNSKEVFADDIQVGDVREHSSTRYTCIECQKSFSQLRNYKYHMSVHRGTKEFATTCPVCGKFFNDKGYLSSHMKIHRNRKEYKCSLCPKSFNQRVAYNMHVRIHTGVKPHVCDECGKAFSRKMLLKQHQRTHSGERPYACPHCHKRFADRSNMTLHLRLHTGVKPFTCSLCPKSFTKKHHLKSHLNFHTGDKPYACPRCQLAFTQSSNMRTHLKKCNV